VTCRVARAAAQEHQTDGGGDLAPDHGKSGRAREMGVRSVLVEDKRAEPDREAPGLYLKSIERCERACDDDLFL
jgi:hypothetical protein